MKGKGYTTEDITGSKLALGSTSGCKDCAHLFLFVRGVSCN